MTTLSIDSGDLKVIEEYAATGYIVDATTNPLFVSQGKLLKCCEIADIDLNTVQGMEFSISHTHLFVVHHAIFTQQQK